MKILRTTVQFGTIRELILCTLAVMSFSLLPAYALAQETQAPAVNEKGLELIGEAMETKLNASRLKDLDKVIELCEEAIGLGLDEENTRFARQMIVGTLYERVSTDRARAERRE